MINIYTVYVHTVVANGKKYVGQCTGDPRRRWGATGHRYKGQMFYKAIQKYGWNNIVHEIVKTNLSREEADELEIELIAKYKSNERQYGYNITLGGRDGAGLPGGKNPNARAVLCLETGKTWECANYCAKDLNVNTASLQESLYHGYKCKGKHYKYVDDDDYKPNKEPHSVTCVQTGQVWKTVRECAAELGVTPRTIWRYVSGVRKHPDGLVFKYCVV